jgi:predicted nucleic acid-binding protein
VSAVATRGFTLGNGGHRAVAGALAGHRLGLAGHAAFEMLSVLTRLPSPLRRTPRAASRLLDANFPASRFLDEAATSDLLSSLAPHGIAGGGLYDALVGAVAAHHGLELATRDRRAIDTYRSLDVDLRILD